MKQTIAGSALNAQTKATPSKYAIARARIGRLSIAEKLLIALSRHPDMVGGYAGYAESVEAEWIDPHPLKNLYLRFPNFEAMIIDRTVMDFGCGDGQQALAMAQRGARAVVGVEHNPIRLTRAQNLSALLSAVRFADKPAGEFDIVISQNAFEHFTDPQGMLRLMLAHVKPGGRLLITFGPPWYSPYGAHMHFFTRLPWVHLLFSERTVMRVRGVYRNTPAEYNYYSEDMNQLSISGFLRLIAAEPVNLTMLKLSCIKGMNFLARIPWLRELFVINVACMLTKESPRLT